MGQPLSFLPPRLRGGAGRFRSVLRDIWYRSPVYNGLLRPRAPASLEPLPVDPWPGDAALGARIALDDRIFVPVSGRAQPEAPEWTKAEPEFPGDPDAELHGFAWLRHLAALGEDGRLPAARFAAGWLVGFGRRWHPLAWRPDIIGVRLWSWIVHRPLIGQLPREVQPDIVTATARQARHLARAIGTINGIAKLRALRGLIAFGLSAESAATSGEGPALLKLAMGLLNRELARQVLPDGGHLSRSPMVQLLLLRDLVDLRALFARAGTDTPQSVQDAIDRAAPMLRFFQHHDGGLALFNSANERPAHLDLALNLADAHGQPLMSAPHSAFHRLAAGKTLVVFDAGAMPETDMAWSHAGTLSFEMSVGKERLIVNCGAALSASSDWRRALRATAAHSTLTLDSTSSSEMRTDGRPSRKPRHIDCLREENDGAQWLDANHDGYYPFNAQHRRRLYLAADGADLRGEDSLTGGAGRLCELRFHLHPSVQASLVQNGAAALLRLPSGAGWRLRIAGGTLKLSDSVYWGAGSPQRSEQLIVSAPAPEDGLIVKWALTQLTAKP